jgi:hypothetical protein
VNKTLIAFAVLVALTLGTMACKEKTPSEHASDAAKSAGKAIKGAAHDASEAVEDAAKEVKESIEDAK